MKYREPDHVEQFLDRLATEVDLRVCAAKRVFEDRRRYVIGACVIRDKMLRLKRKERKDGKD
jgi:hypothetical protein